MTPASSAPEARPSKLIYASHALVGPDSTEMLAICRASLRRNARLGVSGALYFDGRFFFQVLEGARAALEGLFELIRRDRRHRGVIPLGMATIPARRFATSPMRFVDGRRLPELSRDFPMARLQTGCRETAARIEAALAP
jgi:hypothetical protein